CCCRIALEHFVQESDRQNAHFAGFCCVGGCFVSLSDHRSAHPQGVARLCKAQDDRSARRRGGRNLDLAGDQSKNCATGLSFPKKSSATWILQCSGMRIEKLLCLRAKQIERCFASDLNS